MGSQGVTTSLKVANLTNDYQGFDPLMSGVCQGLPLGNCERRPLRLRGAEGGEEW